MWNDITGFRKVICTNISIQLIPYERKKNALITIVMIIVLAM